MVLGVVVMGVRPLSFVGGSGCYRASVAAVPVLPDRWRVLRGLEESHIVKTLGTVDRNGGHPDQVSVQVLKS